MQDWRKDITRAFELFEKDADTDIEKIAQEAISLAWVDDWPTNMQVYQMAKTRFPNMKNLHNVTNRELEEAFLIEIGHAVRPRLILLNQLNEKTADPRIVLSQENIEISQATRDDVTFAKYNHLIHQVHGPMDETDQFCHLLQYLKEDEDEDSSSSKTKEKNKSKKKRSRDDDAQEQVQEQEESNDVDDSEFFSTLRTHVQVFRNNHHDQEEMDQATTTTTTTTTRSQLLEMVQRLDKDHVQRELALGSYIVSAREAKVAWKVIGEELGIGTKNVRSQPRVVHAQKLYKLVAECKMYKLRHVRIPGTDKVMLKSLKKNVASSRMTTYLNENTPEANWWSDDGEPRWIQLKDTGIEILDPDWLMGN